MSATVTLMRFIPNESEVICEDKYEKIDDTFIHSDLLEELVKNFSVVQNKIPEEYNSKIISAYEFFNNDDIRNILDYLENKFIKEIEIAAISLDQVFSQPKIKNIQLKIQSLLNVISVFEIKYKNFADNKYAVVKIGR